MSNDDFKIYYNQDGTTELVPRNGTDFDDYGTGTEAVVDTTANATVVVEATTVLVNETLIETTEVMPVNTTTIFEEESSNFLSQFMGGELPLLTMILVSVSIVAVVAVLVVLIRAGKRF